jgi:hypothetical protein
MAGNAEQQAGISLKRRSPDEVRVVRASEMNVISYQEENVMSKNTTAVSVVTPETMPAITHAGRPVVTTALLAKLYGTDDNNLIKNYQRNAGRFVDGKHFHKLEGADLKAFKHCMTNSQAVDIPRQTRNLILWTERGAARHAKMLDTDQAWDVFEKLEDCYFAKAEQSTALLPHVGLTPAQQRHVQNRVAELAGKDRTKFATIYRGIKDRFMVGSYKDVPESEYPALCMMLMCDPLEGEWFAHSKIQGMHLSDREVQALYLMMSHYHSAKDHADKAGIYAIARLTESHPLMNFYEHFRDIGIGFRSLDERRAEIYRIYSSQGLRGGYAMERSA